MNATPNKVTWRNFSLRTLLAITGGVASLTFLYLSAPPAVPWLAAVLYFAAWLIPTSSYAFDVVRSKRGIIGGVIFGTACASLLLAFLWLVGPFAMCDGAHNINIRLQYANASAVTAVSYIGLHRSDILPHIIANYAPHQPFYTTVSDPSQPFSVSIRHSFHQHLLFGVRFRYGQCFEVIVIRLVFADGTHEYRTIEVPRVDESPDVSLVVQNAM